VAQAQVKRLLLRLVRSENAAWAILAMQQLKTSTVLHAPFLDRDFVISFFYYSAPLLAHRDPAVVQAARYKEIFQPRSSC
jgi:hypothetical protein